MLVTYAFRATNGGLSAPGLTPIWESFQLLTGAPVAVALRPSIASVGVGWYSFAWDSQVNGDACGTIDAGPTITDPHERYFPFEPTRENGIILAGSLISILVSP